jgi:SAM-dependent methyltransferase
MMSLQRIRGVFSYLHAAGPLWNWRIVRGTCPLCGPSYFAVMQPHPFFMRCLTCRASAVNLSVVSFLQKELPDLRNKTVYEMSTYGSTWSFLKSCCGVFHCSEFIPGHKNGDWIDGIRNEDVQQLSFADESLDVITSNQVFEHVPDDLAGYRECWRTLRTGGHLIFTVPIYDTERTVQVARLEGGTIHWLETPEFHASRTTGPNSVPVFWRFSINDICRRVADAGFGFVSLEKIFLIPQQIVPQLLIHAVKER